MPTVPLPQKSVPRLRAKYVLFAFIGLMIAYVLKHNESFLLNAADPAWKHYEPIKWWLLPHGIAGAIAIFLAMSQFSSRLRARHVVVHRTLGRIYVGLVAIAAPLGVAAVETVVWTCVAFAYPLADLVLLLEDRLRSRGTPREHNSEAG